MNIKALDDFDPIVVNRPLTEEDKAVFSAAIAAYKAAKNKKNHVKNLKKQEMAAV
jgi:hypothetical protein